MRVLIFDTETTGLPKTKIISHDTLQDWPYIVQLSYIIYDTERNQVIQIKDFIIKLNDTSFITPEATKINGITCKMSQNGLAIEDVFENLFADIKNTQLLVAHNLDFDFNMCKVELLRLINNNNLSDIEKNVYKHYLFQLTSSTKTFCTMKESIELCNIKALTKKGESYTKFPKLVELYQTLFNETPNNLHNSLNDVLVTLRCFLRLQNDVDVIELCPEVKRLFKKLL